MKKKVIKKIKKQEVSKCDHELERVMFDDDLGKCNIYVCKNCGELWGK